MIKVFTKEYKEGDYAVKDTLVTFLYIPIYKRKDITTNVNIKNALTTEVKTVKVKGFYETKNKSKKTK